MQNELLDLIGDDNEVGFRLDYLEVYNWGTFHQKVWRITPACKNALLTGDIGSGKSTLVDAITTLLVQPQRIIYNKAAGAEGRERTLYSYIRGEYKNEQDDFTQMAKAVALRGENNYSVVLANFYNHGLLQNVTLAQVFWLKDGKTTPERFFVVAQNLLSIQEHFSNFGENINMLKKNLKSLPHVFVFDVFKEYSNKFRQLFGIQNEQALDLFYQTISMKSIGNLTEFVRSHMLEKSDINNSLIEIKRNFENLNQAYEAVVKVKDQITLLQPIKGLAQEYQQVLAKIEEAINCNNLLDGYFAKHHLHLYQEQTWEFEHQLKLNEQKCNLLNDRINDLRQEEKKLYSSIEENGGQRIRELESEIIALVRERDKRSMLAKKYQQLIDKIGLQYNATEDGFYTNERKITEILANTEQDLQQINEEVTSIRIDMKVADKEILGLNNELDSLRSRTSNIPGKILRMRLEMAEVLNLNEDELPFVGELIQVNSKYGEWVGAIERVLHNFGLSLLVTDTYYQAVSEYVEKTDLRGKLVYYRVRDEVSTPKEVPESSVMSKLVIKLGNKFSAWVTQQIQSRFNYICCDNLEEFRRYPMALTKTGQIKSSSMRHEKDDRRSIKDASHYILGWDNKDKIRVLESQQKICQQKLDKYSQKLVDINQIHQSLNNKRDTCRDLSQFINFNEIYWQVVAKEIDIKQAQKIELEKSSDILYQLRAQLTTVQNTINQANQELNLASEYGGGIKADIRSIEARIDEARDVLSAIESSQQELFFPILEQFKNKIFNNLILTLKNIKSCQDKMRTHFNQEINSNNKQKGMLNSDIIRIMQKYKSTYPLDTQEVDVAIEAINDYLTMLLHLEADDLPRHESRFKQLLNEGTINSIALLQNQLKKEEAAIKQKITLINKSLRGIEYSSGTYIELLADSAYDVDIRDFRQQLLHCLSNTIAGENQNRFYNEDKFKQIKLLIDRFRGRPEAIDLDRKWTLKVTDVRNWFNFSASERFIEDNTEKEFYSDSSGKSGGQKEKLAYTVLASALVYQFGLEHDVTNTRSFRFVVIDEAFGRGSDESTRYGLELFKRLHLQLLIITPLQKIRIIEDYINAVHYVHNATGNNSNVRNLTIKQYRELQPHAR